MSNRYINRAYSGMCKELADNVVLGKTLAKDTTMRVGGPAGIFAVADTFDHLRTIIREVNEWGLNFFMLGKGSNLLISDEGYPGVIVRLGRSFMRKRVEGDRILTGAAVSLPILVQLAQNNSLEGLCFAVGIPGSLGGALYMNAGAHGSCLGDLVQSVVVFKKSEKLFLVEKNDLEFAYRKSNFDHDSIIVEATLKLQRGDKDIIKARMEELFSKRKSNQPLKYPNCGSIFKNPKGLFAGELIEKVGCKGARVGDAEISEKHANFIVNRGKARASDVYRLVRLVQQRVFDDCGITLEPEIEFVGEFDELLLSTR